MAVYFAQILKNFARIMANFSGLGMRPYPLHPHAVRLCTLYTSRGSLFWYHAMMSLQFTKSAPLSAVRLQNVGADSSNIGLLHNNHMATKVHF